MTDLAARAPAEHDPVAGIVAMTAAMGCFIVSDVCCKLAAQRGLPVSEVITLRAILSALLLAVPAILAGAVALVREHMGRAWSIRILGEMAAAGGFISALVNLPLANVIAITQTIPLVMTAAGALVLGERVGARNWLATIAGFAGVLLIVRPGTGAFSWWSLGALLCVVAVTVRDIATRGMPRAVPAVVISFTTAIGVVVIGAVMGSLERGWTLPDLGAGLALLVAAAAISGGYWFAILAVQRAALSTVAPFRYAIIPMALAMGYAIWGEVPDVLALAGIAVITVSGLYTFLDARRRRGHTS